MDLAATADPCRIEHHRIYPTGLIGDGIMIEGSTTCRDGVISIRVFDENGNYLGNAHGIIVGYTFDAVMSGKHESPQKFTIKYVIDVPKP